MYFKVVDLEENTLGFWQEIHNEQDILVKVHHNVTSRSRRSAASEMAGRHKKVIWTKQGYFTLDEAVGYVGQDSLTAAQDLLESALDTAESLSIFSERGRIVPELQQPNVRELLVQRYRLIYTMTSDRVVILAFIHGARDLTQEG